MARRKAKNLPKISIVIPTYNEERFIGPCLDSIFRQNYPKNKLQVLVVDSEATTDDTRKIAKKYGVKVINNPKRLAEPAKTLGFKHSSGDLFFYLDADAELVSKNWFNNLVFPFLDDPEIAGGFTRYVPRKTQTAFNRYVSYSPLQLWSMLSYLLPSISDATIEKGKKYDVVKINLDRSPPIGICMYRKKFLDKVITSPDKFLYVDIAIPLQLAELGYDKLAYVEKAGLYHFRKDLLHELKRQKRDVTVTYLPDLGKRKFNYIDFKNPFDILRVIAWVVYANLIIPSLIVGIYKSIKFRDWAGMYEAPTNFLLTNYIIYLFISKSRGRELIKKVILRKV